MLLLARRAGEAVLLDGGIRITVVAVEGRTVRLGIEAPPEVGILRAEIADDLAADNRSAVPTRAAVERSGLLPPGSVTPSSAPTAPATSGTTPPAPDAPAGPPPRRPRRPRR